MALDTRTSETIFEGFEVSLMRSTASFGPYYHSLMFLPPFKPLHTKEMSYSDEVRSGIRKPKKEENYLKLLARNKKAIGLSSFGLRF